MAEKPELKLYADLGGAVQAVYERADVRALHHTVVRMVSGAEFNPAAHWPCEVCDHHDFTLNDFAQQWPAAVESARQRGITIQLRSINESS